MQTGRGLDHMRDTSIRDDLGVHAFDVFCTAAFSNSMPWIASLELFLSAGVAAIADYDQALIERLVTRVDSDRYEMISPLHGDTRSTFVVLARRDGSTQQRHHQLTAAGIYPAFREGNLRVSVHLFNTLEQIDEVLHCLHE